MSATGIGTLPSRPDDLGRGRLWQSLARLGEAAGTHLATAVLAYALIVWPLAFGDSEVSLSEQAMGWLAAPPAKDGSSLKIVAYPTFFVLGALCFAVSGAYRRAPWGAPVPLVLAAFVALAASSAAWSGFPSETFLRASLCGLVVATLFFAAYTARDYGTVAKGLFWTFFAITVLNVVALFVLPPSPIGYTGIYPHKNFFGYVSALILYFALHAFSFGPLIYRVAAVPMLLLAPAFLLASESKTSVGLAGLAPVVGAVMWAARRRLGLSPLLVLAVPAATIAGIFFVGRAAGLWDFALVNKTLLGSATLTGRTEIWEVARFLIGERPLLGWGYEAVWNMGADGIVTRNAVGFVRIMPTAHNGYIDVLVQLGTVGFALLLVFLALVLVGIGRLLDVNGRLGWFAGTLTTFVLLHNLLESDVLVSSNQLSMVFLLYVFVALRAVRSAREAERAT